MTLSNRKLYLSYRKSRDLQVRGEVLLARAIANSIETLLGEGKTFEEALRDSYVLRELNRALEIGGVVEFLIRCWAYGTELSCVLWKMRDRRQRPRGPRTRQVEIEMT
jgi:hypothetical protein